MEKRTLTRNTHFFMMPLGWYRDPQINNLPAGALNVWVGLLEHCQVAGNGGVMTWGEIYTVSRSFARGTASVRALIDRGTLVVDGSFDGETTVVRVSNPARWLLVSNPRMAISADGERGVASSGVAESRARVKIEREIEREEERTPSGSVRSSSARAAPRSAGGAARPALAVVDGRGTVVKFRGLSEALTIQAEMAIRGNVRARKLLDEKHPDWESHVVVEEAAEREIESAAAE